MKKKRGKLGFTLIEILVVLFIMSIVASVALLTISRNQNKRIELFVNELTQTLTLAEEEAMLKPAVLGLTLKSSSLQFSRYQSSREKNQWIPIQDQALSQRAIPRDIELGLEVGNAHQSLSEESAEKNNQPQIIISMNGDVTPFTVYVGKKGEKPRYVITGNADGSVTSRMRE